MRTLALLLLLVIIVASSCSPQTTRRAEIQQYGFIAPIAAEVTTPADLEGKTICVQRGSTTELVLQAAMDALDIAFNLVTYESSHTVLTEYEAGSCDVMSTVGSGLASAHRQLNSPAQHEVPNILYTSEGTWVY